MRTLTTYQRPSLTEVIAGAPSIQQLAAYRAEMAELFRAGRLSPSVKTRRAWLDALWVRVMELIAGAGTPEEAALIYNTVLLWPKPASACALIEAIFARRVAALPSPAERLALMGVEVVR